MKKIFFIILFVFFEKNIKSQSFSIKLSPDTISVVLGQNASFSLTALPTGGFSASVFLTLQNFQTSLVTISPTTINPPYNNCTVDVSTSNLSLGIYPVVIKGQQGSIISYDTAYVNVLFNANLKWYQFKQQNSGLLCNEPQSLAIDKNNFVYVTSGSTDVNCGQANYGISMYDHSVWKRWTNSQYTITDFLGHIDTTKSFSWPSANCNGIAVDTSNTLWIGSDTGLIKIKNDTFTYAFPGDQIGNISTFNNKVCVATNSGVRYYNGTTWQIFNTSNSYLPNNSVYSVAMENDTVLWIGTLGGGLARYDMHFWNVYDNSNSIIPNNNIWALAIDKLNNKWIATSGSGLIKYDNSTWQQFTPPCQEISTIYPDYQNNIWLGFWSGNANNCLVKYDGSSWTQYNSSNSGFASDATTPGYGRIHDITQDNNHVLWVSTFGDGLFAFSDSGLATILPSNLISGINNNLISSKDDFRVLLYPNPSKDNFNITCSEKADALIITNLLGEIIVQIKPDTKNVPVCINQNGVFFVHIIIGNSTITQKIIITN